MAVVGADGADSDHPWFCEGEVRRKVHRCWLCGIDRVIADGANDNGTQPAATTGSCALDGVGDGVARTRVAPAIVDHIGVCGVPRPVDGICDVRLGVFQVVAENARDNEVDVRRDTTGSLSIVCRAARIPATAVPCASPVSFSAGLKHVKQGW